MNNPELRAVLTEALSRSYYRIVGSSSDCRVDPGEILADAVLSLPGVAVIQLPEPGEGVWKLTRRSTYGLVCVTCGVAYGGWRRAPHEAERDRVRAERYGCSTCKNRKTVAALPEHHAHHEHNPDWSYVSGGYCCAATQMKAIGPNDCAKCGEPYPCAAAVLAAGEEHHG
ncbi:hypothetical protein I5H63_gp079 [Mycobacterium phage MilleniumForce]|uniref:Uncharacterized protein n=1 Tax=Mycobacterium phage MilleniumForce TaxID=2315711 RepID=A0A386KPC4_9CAUD|nr:hypothetical protein I5H63_gp079 [Mycobacterium phage MilleniumForce]AYD86904.1 hypothetical protein SEA_MILLENIUMFORCE_79 [Mycobacterium phage MilleniumForce]